MLIFKIIIVVKYVCSYNNLTNPFKSDISKRQHLYSMTEISAMHSRNLTIKYTLSQQENGNLYT